MKVLIVLACVLFLGGASPVLDKLENYIYNKTYFLVEDSPGVFHKEPLIGVPRYNAVDSDVTMYYFSKTAEEVGIEVNLFDDDWIEKTDFSNSKKTIFVIHGWKSDHTTELNSLICRAYLSVREANVFIVDWSKLAEWDYITAQANVESVGKIVGKMINNLVSNNSLNLENTVIIGHSLGAHVAGVAGKAVGGTAEIVGLDPAGLLFTMINEANRIGTKSGRFVQIIHTNAGQLGFDHQLGHVDYWPNGGHHQLGCGLDELGMCSHKRAYEYFAESIESGQFIANICTDWAEYKRGECDTNKSSWLGQDQLDTSASGDYFLATDEHSPYAKG